MAATATKTATPPRTVFAALDAALSNGAAAPAAIPINLAVLDAPLDKAIAAAPRKPTSMATGTGANVAIAEEEAPPAQEEPPALPQPDLARSDSATWDIFGGAADAEPVLGPGRPGRELRRRRLRKISQEDILAGLSSPAPPVAPAAATVSFTPAG